MTIYKISTDKREFHPRFHKVLGERVVITGEVHLGKYPIKFIGHPELIEVCQRVRKDLLIPEK